MTDFKDISEAKYKRMFQKSVTRLQIEKYSLTLTLIRENMFEKLFEPLKGLKILLLIKSSIMFSMVLIVM